MNHIPFSLTAVTILCDRYRLVLSAIVRWGKEADMPSLIVSRDSHLYNVFPVKGTTKIGRSRSNAVIIEAAGVSRHHASIEETPSGFVLQDAGSTNGTFVGNQRIQSHPLQTGSSFRIIDYLFTFVEDIQPEPAPEPPTDTFGNATLLDSSEAKLMRTHWLTEPVALEKDLAKKIGRLLKLVLALGAAGPETDPGEVVFDALFEITGARRGVIVCQTGQGGPVFTHLRGFSPQDAAPRVSHSILSAALDQGHSVLRRCADEEDPSESVHGLGLKSVLCVPLIADEKVLGCIYLDDPDFAGVFTELERDLVVAASAYIAESFQPAGNKGHCLPGKDARFAKSLAEEGIIASSPKTIKVFQDAQTIAPYQIAVLIFGETGTGKEVIARYVHNQSGRSGKFIARNCSALAPSMIESELFGHEKGAFTGATQSKQGIFELACKGTIFLDEIGDMPVGLQAKLLRALQEQEIWRVGGCAPVKIDVRVIAATHRDIKNRREQLNFRDDLYYRLANVEITAPSLRDRPEDIEPLAQRILTTFSQEHPKQKKEIHLSTKALRLLHAYEWPGNIRELRNMLIQVALKCDGATIEPRHLKGHLDVFTPVAQQGTGPISPLEEVERVHIIKALERTSWNKSAAAKVLQMDRNRLDRWLKKLDINAPAGR